MNKKFNSGPESIPLMTPVTDFPLTISVYDANDLVVKEETIQYSNYEHRKYLGKLTYWACSNGYTVETRKATPDEAKKLK